MNYAILIASLFFFGAHATTPQPHLLGSKECTWGPSYWCKNLTAAASCHATKHCIQTDWIHRQLEPDNSNICQTCLDMVKQARDQLLSNETQDLIKQVFEGTCNLTHFKVIVKECDKIVDNFIPDLIDTLASEMNPQVVCSVAGLCNNRLYLEFMNEDSPPSSTLKSLEDDEEIDSCTGCRSIVNTLETKLNSKSKDEVLQGFLMVCRKTGSFSDACSNVILTYFTEIYAHIKEHFNPAEVCVLSGQCSALFHTHNSPQSKVQITSMSDIGFVHLRSDKDDLPCQLCEQLVKHLRDILIANTTQEEFKQILEGLCKQTKSFADQCSAFVDEYYGMVYQFLVQELNATAVCNMVGICPGGEDLKNIAIAPLLPEETAGALEIGQKSNKKATLARVPLTKGSPSIQILSNPALADFQRPEEAQLPIDILMSPYDKVLYNKELCEFCQFFLHYVQQLLTSPTTEEEIDRVVKRACNDLPSSMNETCVQFVENYEPALVALLAQEIDPSQICPLIRACPSGEVRDVDIFMRQEETGDNSKCPLCLFAVQKLEEMVENKKTEAEIEDALKQLCTKLPQELSKECQNFVDLYSKSLVDMLIADLNPKEVCVALKLCTDKKPAPPVMKPLSFPELTQEIESNNIADNTINGITITGDVGSQKVGSVECALCKIVAKIVYQFLKNNETEAEIEKILGYLCPIIPEVNNEDCQDFIDQYTHSIIEILQIVSNPSDVCPVIQLCASPQIEHMKTEIFDCSICEAAVWAMEKILANPKVDHEMKHVLEKTCRALPSHDQAKCREIIEEYGTDIFKLIERMANKNKICREIGLCGRGGKIQMKDADRLIVSF